MRAAVTFDVSDDFSPGQCDDCPLSYLLDYDEDGYTDCCHICSLGFSYCECPLTIDNIN